MRRFFAIFAIFFSFSLICGVLPEGCAAQPPQETAPFVLVVNKTTNTVTVYQADVATRVFVCSTGANTPPGTFHTSDKLRWHALVGNVYGQYCTRITGSILFHSLPYARNGDPASLDTSAFNKLGTEASHGCVRLMVKDAKWIFDHCPSGTTVNIVQKAVDPLPKPPTVTLKAGQGFDPTDPDVRNPFTAPKITVPQKPLVVQIGTKLDLSRAVSAKDTVGNPLAAVTIAGRVNRKKPGSYVVRCAATDALGNTARASFVVRMVDRLPPTLTVRTDFPQTPGQSVALRKGLKARNAAGRNLNRFVEIEVTLPDGEVISSIPKSVFVLPETPGEIVVTYRVQNPTNGKTKTVTRQLTIDS